jgi:uncharacterized protein
LDPEQRVLAVDVVRGFALLGVLLVNMGFFAAPFHAILLETPWWTALPDRIAEFGVRTLAEGKFYLLFSLLFGVGMSIQMQRAAERGRGFAGYYVRRLLVLLGIGLAHALCLWYGDILTAYALLGFLLLPFRRRRDRTVLIWSGIIYLLPVLIMGAVAVAVELGRRFAAAEIAREFEGQAAEFRRIAAAAVEVYAHGSWSEIFQQRLIDLAEISVGYVMIGPAVLSMFLLGLYVGRRRILHEPEAHLRLLRGLVYFGLPLGLILNVGHAVGREFTTLAEPSPAGWLVYVALCIGTPLLGFGYAAGLVLLLRTERWRERLRPLAAVGRMALTNYLLQTLICTTVFYSYGLGLFGRVGPAVYVPLALVLYALQVPLSVWWLRRFRFGPMEWVWRTLTYGMPQPLRVSGAPEVPH